MPLSRRKFVSFAAIAATSRLVAAKSVHAQTTPPFKAIAFGLSRFALAAA